MATTLLVSVKAITSPPPPPPPLPSSSSQELETLMASTRVFAPSPSPSSSTPRRRGDAANAAVPVVRPPLSSLVLIIAAACASAAIVASWRRTAMHQLYVRSSTRLNRTAADAGADDVSPGDARLNARQHGQVRSFRSGHGLLLHLRVTHHAGTTFCHAMGQSARLATSSAGATTAATATASGAPPFACRIDRHEEWLNANLTSDPRFFSRVPWLRNETQPMINLLRPYYHMVSFEFGRTRPPMSLHLTDWDNPHLVSVFVSRDPMERMLAEDAYVETHYKVLTNTTSNHSNISSPTRDDWWDFANMTAFGYVDNFMLRVLSNDSHCCQGSDTPRQRLEEAMELLGRFTFVLDARCLDEGMMALAEILGLDGTAVHKSLRHGQRLHHVRPVDVSTRYPYRDVYDYLVRKNRLDLELYRWTQSRALVRCSS